MKPNFTIAVRSLVEYVLRSGDLRSDFLGSVRAVEGIRAHQQIQRRRPKTYQAEVPVEYVVEREAFQLRVSGRIDGVLASETPSVVEEIKSTRRPLEELEENPNPIHWGQVQCYAYMWAVQEGVEQVAARLTYIHLDNNETRELVKPFELDDLACFFNDLLERYLKWVLALAQWCKVRDASILKLDFPFPSYRHGQRAMAVEVYRVIRAGGHLLVQAATGIGKTMAVLFPAIKALGAKLAPKVVFLTARTTGRLAAETALQSLRNNGLRIKSVTMTAKEKICFNPDSACSPEECDCAQGYYDRINDALFTAFMHDALTRETIEAVAREHRVCPFEFSLELVSWADCVIGDYNYAFAPGVMLQRLFGEGGERHAVLVDEAHNLVDRSREMFSARLSKDPVLALRRLLKTVLPGVYGALGRINTYMVAARRRCREGGGSHIDKDLPHELLERLRVFLRLSEKWLALNVRSDFRDDLMTFFFDAVRFVRVAESYDQSYVTICQTEGDDLQIKLFCIDPSNQLHNAWQRCQSAVLFSATLTPADYFLAVLGCSQQAKRLNLASPFPISNLSVFIADRISTLYRERENSCSAVSRAIANLVRRRTGHYIIYFPSYKYLSMIHAQFVQECEEIEVLVQTPEMAEVQREAFLNRFHEKVSGTLVGFAVLGGIFGEGIDLKGERLTGAVIVGVGLPGIGLERDLIREYYDREMGDGFEFAYQYPGINRVLQAAGRVIRSEHDRGVVLLIDRRYGQQRYHVLLPPHWQSQGIGSENRFLNQLDDFWKNS